MKKITQLILAVSFIFGLFSCSMVKQPQAVNNFQRVKYNAHLNLAKKQESKKLNTTANSFKEVAKIEETKAGAEIAKSNNTYKNELVASNSSKQKINKAQELDLTTIQDKVALNNFDFQLSLNKIRNKEVRPTSNFIAEPMPAAAKGDLGSLLYIILVVILALIIIGFLSNLAGGLIGLLIAILVILLILRLLGIA